MDRAVRYVLLRARDRRSWITAAVLIGITFAVACGASVSTVYEGDVRFERCMALDWQHDVDPEIRRGCWKEWVSYYTFGQTRDRIEYAQHELEQLEPSAHPMMSSEPKPLLAIPEPTNVFAPPPMMMETHDGGDGDGGAVGDGGDAGPKKSECEVACEDRATECLKVCKGPVCAKGCSAFRSKCLEKCEAGR